MPNILIVDDNDVTAKFLESLLKQKGHQVKVLGNGSEIVDEVRKFSPQLILMDILLPDMNGAEAVEMLQQDVDLRRIPVIFLSAIIEQDGQKRSILTIHDKNYPALSKMITTNDLLNTIQTTLRNSS